MKIISGGQTGVDRAALDTAMALGVEGGGWCPAGRLAEDGPLPPRYPLRELPGGGYVERTALNVSDADGTVIFHAGLLQGGTRATAEFCAEMSKPSLLIDASHRSPEEAAAALESFISSHRIGVLNVAGPRESQWPLGYGFTCETLSIFLWRMAGGPMPEISFVVPAHNEEHELPETLRALRHAADASGASYELIVVDDASTDATPKIARQFGARVIEVDRRQIAAVRNAGARVARGEILFFVDADTRITADHVRSGINALEEGCVGGSARVALDGRPALVTLLFLRIFSLVYFAAGLGVGAFIFARRASFEKAGGFDEQYFAGEEVYLTLALKKLGRFKILRQPIVTSARKMRMHSPLYVIRQFLFICFGGKGALRKRERLALWYDGRREQETSRGEVERLPAEV
ncbi:MAG: YpsA SLOG family protein [Chthoniobacterales bacterium]